VRSFRADGNLEARNSQHGILCGEIIHALAPEAGMLLANWDVEKPDSFLDAVRWARQQGARIISCSVVMPSCSDGEGGGAVHADLARLLGSGKDAGDLLCFASAGNTTDRHWSGAFSDRGDGWHEWGPAQIDNGLRPWGEDTISVELYGKPGLWYEVVVFDDDTGDEVSRAKTDPRQTDRSAAVVRFPPVDDHHYRVRVRHLGGAAGPFHVATMWSSLEVTTPRGSVCFPADGVNVIAMGAVDAGGHKHRYSACGPNSPRPKPDLVATVPFPSLCRSRPFGGTSAAAPQGAGLAALWLSRHPEWTAEQVRDAVQQAASDLGPRGHDGETGYGLICLPGNQSLASGSVGR
jgi:subtilisin family serine protease